MSVREGISVALPLEYDYLDGPYRLNKNLKEVVIQNFKNLVLTSPGERIMLPDFGCGLRQMLFENMDAHHQSTIAGRINAQIEKYMPFVTLEDIVFSTAENNPSLSLNQLSIFITITIMPLNEQATLEINELLA
jgi:phage baseplate assembly protein W